MDRKRVYKKTEKGEEEIRTRKYGLSQDHRHILIFVDGSSSVSKILEKGAGFPNIEQHLDELASQGFILATTETVTVSGIKEELIAAAQKTLGDDAEKVISKIKESPDTKEGLEATLGSCKRMVRLVIDEKKAEELMTRCSEIMERL